MPDVAVSRILESLARSHEIALRRMEKAGSQVVLEEFECTVTLSGDFLDSSFREGDVTVSTRKPGKAKTSDVIEQPGTLIVRAVFSSRQ